MTGMIGCSVLMSSTGLPAIMRVVFWTVAMYVRSYRSFVYPDACVLRGLPEPYPTRATIGVATRGSVARLGHLFFRLAATHVRQEE